MTELVPLLMVEKRARAVPRATVGVAKSKIQRGLKRAVDVVGASVGLVLGGPILLAAAVVVYLDSGGPIFFRQDRVGRHGRLFRIWKLRTMLPSAETKLEAIAGLNESGGDGLFKIKRDPRLTRVGGFLRKSSIDEIPQFLNILRGEMSLVGPRPLPLRDCDLLEKNWPDLYAGRLRVTPGLTGPWQVGGRSNLSSREMLDLDNAYVESTGLGTDVKILLRTVQVVVLRRGAY